MNKETAGTLLALATAIVSGVAIPVNKAFIVNMDPAVFTAVRSIIIGVIFLALSLKFSGKKTKTNWKYMAIIAVIGGAFAFLLYFTGLKLTTASRAAFLHKTLPFYVAVLAFVFLKEKISRRYAYAMIMMVVGIVAIYYASISPAEMWLNPHLGDALIIIATMMWAVENVIARKAMLGGATNYIVSFSRMFFGGLIIFGFAALTGKAGAIASITAPQLFNISVSTALLFAYVLFFYSSLRFINASKAAALLLLSPVISLVLGITFLGEPAPLLQLGGSVVILLGAYLMAGMKSEQRGI